MPINEKVSWKTERKESFIACWALSRSMSTFSPIYMFAFANHFFVSTCESFFHCSNLDDIALRHTGEKVSIGLFFYVFLLAFFQSSNDSDYLLSLVFRPLQL